MIACPDMPWWPMSKRAGEQIQDMVDVSKRVTYETMRKHCEGLVDWLLWKGVVTERRGMVQALKESDWITFNKSNYDGIPCYYVDWSGIEFIWMQREFLEDEGIEIREPPWEMCIDPRHEHMPDFPGCTLRMFKPKR